LTAEDLKNLEKGPDGILKVIDGCKSEFSTLLGDLEGVRQATLHGLQDRLADVQEQVQSRMDLVAEHVEAIDFILLEKKQEAKVDRNSVRYLKTKVQNKLMSGGFGKNLAKDISGMPPSVVDRDVELASFPTNHVTVWTEASSDATVVSLLKLFSADANKLIDEKKRGLGDILDTE